MRTASWIVTSHFRPALLKATLDHLNAAREIGQLPDAWQVEIVVAHAARDRESADVAHRAGALVVPTTEAHPSGKRNHALRECSGELVMTTDDDDFQSYQRPALAIGAYEGGWKVSGIREFRRLHLASGNVVRYLGRGTDAEPRVDLPQIPPVMCGTARNYAKDTLVRVHGWRHELAQLEDHDLQKRIRRRRGHAPAFNEYDFGDALADTTIICQHESNIVARPEVAKGSQIVHGEYVLVGEGHWSELPDFPRIVAQRLTDVGKL